MQTSLMQAFKTHLVNELHFNSNLFYSQIAITSATLDNGNITLNLANEVVQIQNIVEGVSSVSFENQQIAVAGIFLKNSITNIQVVGNYYKITLSKPSRITLDYKTITLEGFTDTAWNGSFALYNIRQCDDYDFMISKVGLELPQAGNYGYVKESDNNNIFCGNKVASMVGSANVLTYSITNETIPDAELPEIVIDNAFIKYQWKITLAIDVGSYLKNFFTKNATSRQLLCTFGGSTFTNYNGDSMEDNIDVINGAGIVFRAKERSQIKFYAILPFVQSDLSIADKIAVMEQADGLKTSLMKTICKNLEVSVVDVNGFTRKITNVKPLSSEMEAGMSEDAYCVYSYTFTYSADVSEDAYYNRPLTFPLRKVDISHIDETNGNELKRTQNQF